MPPFDPIEALHSILGGPRHAVARLVVIWTLAGGSIAGGGLTGALALFGRGAPGLLLLVGPLLYLAGTVAGLVHGVALGVVGRPAGMARTEAWRAAGLGAVVALPLLPLSWLTSAAITVGSTLPVDFRVDRLLVAVVGWALAAGLSLWASVEGWRRLRRAYGRCRLRRLGVAAMGVLAVCLALALEGLGPAMPVLGRSPGWGVSIPVSALLTFWLWLPLVDGVLGRSAPGDIAPGEHGTV